MEKRYISLLKKIQENHENAPKLTANSKILIIDGMNLFLRIFSAVPSVNDDGSHVGGLSGFLRSLAYTIRLLDPTRCIIVFDGKGGSARRRKIYPEYKNNRRTAYHFNRLNDNMSIEEEKASQLIQLSRCAEYLENLPLNILSIDNIEADDTISYITKQVMKNSEIIIMSSDKDFLQLVDDRISVWSPTKKKLYNPQLVYDEYGIPASNFLIYKMLTGDASDNIPGIPGCGLKTILKRFPELQEENVSIKTLFETASKYKDDYVVYNNLLNNKFKLKLNYLLMQLHDVDISNNAKLKISTTINESIPELNRAGFQLLFVKDQLWTVIPNSDTWLEQSFFRLNQFAKIYNGTKN